MVKKSLALLAVAALAACGSQQDAPVVEETAPATEVVAAPVETAPVVETEVVEVAPAEGEVADSAAAPQAH